MGYEEKSIYYMYSFATKVLAVAKVNIFRNTDESNVWKTRDWAAYIDAVPGESHQREMQEVARVGSKLPKTVAEIIFPDLPINKWRR